MTVTATISGIDELVASLSKVPSRVVSGVKTTDEKSYIIAMVWAYGYVTRTINPGPKTLWSVNYYGEPKVLTITAPTGFIRVQEQDYRRILNAEFAAAAFASKPISSWSTLAVQMMTNAAQRCAQITSQAAPIDKGDLRASIVAALPGDTALSGSGVGPYGTAFTDVADAIFGGS